MFRDESISGYLGRQKGLRSDVLYRAGQFEFDIVAAWSLCRFGSSPRKLICSMRSGIIGITPAIVGRAGGELRTGKRRQRAWVGLLPCFL